MSRFLIEFEKGGGSMFHRMFVFFLFFFLCMSVDISVNYGPIFKILFEFERVYSRGGPIVHVTKLESDDGMGPVY